MFRAAPTKVIIPTARSVGAISRRTMRRYVVHHDAPATREASSSSAPSCMRPLLMIWTPSGIPAMTPAMMSSAVVPYSGRRKPTPRKSHRSARPRMMPGTVKGSQETTSSRRRPA